MKKILAVLMSIALVMGFAACGVNVPAEREDPEIPEVSENTEVPKPEKAEPEYTEIGERREVSSENYKNAVEIVLSEEITVGGKPASESDFVAVGGEIVYYHDLEKYPSGNPYGEGEKEDRHSEEEASEHTLITIKKPGEYFIRGELKGQIAVDLGEEAKNDPSAKVTLIFGGADIVCEIAPAVIFYNVYECETLSAEPSPEVDTSKAGANILLAEGSISNISGANVAKIFEDNSEEEKLHKYDSALYSKMSMNIGGEGSLNVYAENEGIGSEMHLSVNGGTINVVSEDDGINTNEDGISVTAINGGKLNIKGGNGIEGDGIDSNGWIIINGGELFASGNERAADGGVDADNGIYINGGTVFAYGNKNDRLMENSDQIFASLEFEYEKEAESKIEFIDPEGKTISFVSERAFRNAVVSTPELRENVEYNLYVNGNLQEYSSNVTAFDDFIGTLKGIFGGSVGKENREEIVPENPYKAPDNLEQWMGESEDMPEEIREWIETMKGVSDGMESFSERPHFVPDENGDTPKPEFFFGEGGMDLDEGTNDPVLFIITPETRYFSGIFDSFRGTGKKQVSFTIDGEERLFEMFKGEIPNIKSVECSEEVPSEHIVLELSYRGRDKEKEFSRSCLLSEGYEKINGLFEGLEAGNYCLRVSVSEDNEDYGGISEFNFRVVD